MVELKLNPPPSTIFCRFCNAVISFKSGTKEKFEKHMEMVHEIHLDTDLLLAIHFIEDEEKDILVQAAQARARSIVGLPNLTPGDDLENGKIAFLPTGARITFEKSRPDLMAEGKVSKLTFINREKLLTQSNFVSFLRFHF